MAEHLELMLAKIASTLVVVVVGMANLLAAKTMLNTMVIEARKLVTKCKDLFLA